MVTKEGVYGEGYFKRTMGRKLMLNEKGGNDKGIWCWRSEEYVEVVIVDAGLGIILEWCGVNVFTNPSGLDSSPFELTSSSPGVGLLSQFYVVWVGLSFLHQLSPQDLTVFTIWTNFTKSWGWALVTFYDVWAFITKPLGPSPFGLTSLVLRAWAIYWNIVEGGGVTEWTLFGFASPTPQDQTVHC